MKLFRSRAAVTLDPAAGPSAREYASGTRALLVHGTRNAGASRASLTPGSATTAPPQLARVRPRERRASPGWRHEDTQEGSIVMAIAILGGVIGLVLGAAALGIPQLVRIRHRRPDDDDLQAYLKATGRSAQDIAQGNAWARQRQQNTDSDRYPTQ